LNLKNVLKGLAVKDLETAVDFNCKIRVQSVIEIKKANLFPGQLSGFIISEIN